MSDETKPKENRTALNRPDSPRGLDPKSPLTIDTRELGRRPGTMRTLSRSLPALVDLGNGVYQVPEGTEIELELRLESVMEGVLVTGTVWTTAVGECVRCLEELEEDFELSFQELYVYPDSDSVEEDEEVLRLEGDYLDLEPVLRDAVVLALPLQPVCREDCPGLCSECGARLADDPDHHHESTDPRWSALEGLHLRETGDGPEARD